MQALFPWIVLFGAMWFILIRPQQKKQREREKMLRELQRGDQVVTVGGVHGSITAIQDDVVKLRIASGVEITLNRSGVAYPLQKAQKEEG